MKRCIIVLTSLPLLYVNPNSFRNNILIFFINEIIYKFCQYFIVQYGWLVSSSEEQPEGNTKGDLLFFKYKILSTWNREGPKRPGGNGHKYKDSEGWNASYATQQDPACVD